MGGPTSSYATAGIALRVIGVLKPPHHDKVETPPPRRALSILNSKHSWLEEADVFEKVHSLFQIYVGMDM
jgi:hypothetical protein